MSHSKALAIQSWGKGTPVALGAGGKKRRRENDEDSDEVGNHLLLTLMGECCLSN